MAVNALTRPCGESPLAEEAALWLRERVYQEYDEPPTLELDLSSAVTKEGWAEHPTTIAAGPAPGTVVIGADDGAPGLLWDLYTGAWLDAPPAQPVPDVTEGPPARGLWALDRVGWPDGPAGAQGYILARFLQDGTQRVFAFDPAYDGWREVAGCAEDGWGELFTADGQVWRSWVEDDVLLRWMPLLPE